MSATVSNPSSPRSSLRTRLLGLTTMIGGLSLLSACATISPAPREEFYDGPRQVQANYDWVMDLSEDEPVLAYGVQNSDDAPLIMDCLRGTGKVRVSVAAEDARQRTLQFATDRAHRSFSAQNDLDGLTGTHRMETHIDASDPLFSAMEAAGWVAVRTGKTWNALVPHEGTKLAASQFAQTCR
ncbi:hypothetical protein [Brevundimonas sp.]|uniref:hypothetical protein n=1 Tax=Brevundimonas sp. TaxID=1871086 RepID=UPI0028A13393|nr:hypothetical protein [Brevundimonas sp.]